VFGWRVHKRLRGKLSSMLERTEYGHHVLRAYAKNAVMRMYEKFSTFLRLEALSNNKISADSVWRWVSDIWRIGLPGLSIRAVHA
jgi:hypothetical protein